MRLFDHTGDPPDTPPGPVMGRFEGGPLDGQPDASFDEWTGAGAPPRVVYIAHPYMPGVGRVFVGDALDALKAPMEGQPDQHVYEPATDHEPAGSILVRVPTSAPLPHGFIPTRVLPLATYQYKGTFPKVDLPEAAADDGPRYTGPVKLPCPEACIVPPGIDALELLESDEHEIETVMTAQACPNTDCARLFVLERTPEPSS